MMTSAERPEPGDENDGVRDQWRDLIGAARLELVKFELGDARLPPGARYGGEMRAALEAFFKTEGIEIAQVSLVRARGHFAFGTEPDVNDSQWMFGDREMARDWRTFFPGFEQSANETMEDIF